MQQHFVTFYSPGTFVDETTSKPIDSWDVDKAKEMARAITERYSATPFAFSFSTRGRKDDELDSRELATSPMYYLGGEIFTIDQIRERGNPDERILLANMEGNGYDRVIFNHNSWRTVKPLFDNDIVLEWEPVSIND